MAKSKRVLLSIHCQHATNIYNESKQFEYRKIIWNNKSIRTVLLYETWPVKRITGEFTIASITKATPDELWDTTYKHSGLNRKAFYKYFGNSKIGFAIGIKDVKRYSETRSLSDYEVVLPQSFCYIRGDRS